MLDLLFINIGFSDIIDILLVAYLIYSIYKLVKGTAAINIFFGLVTIFLIWKLVGMLQMKMLDEILGQFISVGVLALIIVFQQEIRSFLLMLGKVGRDRNGKLIFMKKVVHQQKIDINTITLSMEEMSKQLTGALIVLRRTNELQEIIDTGEEIDAIFSAPLLESIFYKNNPLHDGAVIIYSNKIVAARCVLPVSKKTDFPADFGLRHRAAAGLTQNTDALVLIVSEQTGNFAYSDKGQLYTNVSIKTIKELLLNEA
ncbi:MAG: TIGR00159 family protein [Bacteroidetes bacterium]|nr:MAG: TIGR00159 family protein [Bacteroidota bacterium]